MNLLGKYIHEAALKIWSYNGSMELQWKFTLRRIYTEKN